MLNQVILDPGALDPNSFAAIINAKGMAHIYKPRRGSSRRVGTLKSAIVRDGKVVAMSTAKARYCQ